MLDASKFLCNRSNPDSFPDPVKLWESGHEANVKLLLIIMLFVLQKIKIIIENHYCQDLLWFDYSLDQLFQYLALFHATARKIFCVIDPPPPPPQTYPPHALSTPYTQSLFSRENATQSSKQFACCDFFRPSSQITFFCLFNSTLEFSRTTLKRDECQDGSEFSPRALLRSLRGPLFPFHRRIAPR